MADSHNDAVTSFDPWSQLWRDTSRPAWDLLSDNAVGLALRDHWNAQSEWIASCAHVLDIGSGPGVLARLLRTQHHGRVARTANGFWTCIDQAHIATSVLDDLPQVTGQFGQGWEKLSPPEVPAHHALLSNFGLEYVSRDHVKASCAQWLADGGRLHAVLHAKDSVIDRQSAQGLADLDLVLDELDLPRRVDGLLAAKATAPTDPMKRMIHGVEVRDEFNHCINRMKAVLEERGTKDGSLLEWMLASRDLLQTVSDDVTLSSARERLQHLRTAYDAERKRLRAMRAAALDPTGLDTLRQGLEAVGFESVRAYLLECSIGPVAWVLDALRRAGPR